MDDQPLQGSAVDSLFDDVIEWLMAQALSNSRHDQMIDGLCKRVFASGIPILRAHFAFTVIHPLYSGQGFTWYRDRGIEPEAYAHSPEGQPERFRRSPQFFMIQNRIFALRRRLTGPRAQLDFPILEELEAAGGTDYYSFLIQFGDSTTDGILGSWLTDRPGGFTEDEIRALARLERSLGVAIRMQVKSGVAESILNTYLGDYAGERVLAGQIKRGDGETIRAAIWYSDLRGSTEMAESLERETFTEILNCYFECMGGAIQDAGGQILDFIGDGVLAVFPVVKGGLTERRACERALAAARDAERRLSKTNADRAKRGLPRLAYGLGLHLGEVMFGNIGTPDRLAYSVIGTSVNQVSRLQDMTKTLKRTPVVSGAFADKLGRETWEDLGTHRLRGVTEPMRLLAPAR